MTQLALIPSLIEKTINKSAKYCAGNIENNSKSFLNGIDSRILLNILSVASGVVLLSALAQVVIPLPWTPVPITGQTFGVALLALCWGRARGMASILTYISVGALGLPVFAGAQSGLSFGPTMGYLVGMVVSSFVVGGLADKGWTNSFSKTLAAAFIGSVFVFGFGLLALSFFVPKELLLSAGLLPFLPGDLIKNTVAATIAWQSKKRI